MRKNHDVVARRCVFRIGTLRRRVMRRGSIVRGVNTVTPESALDRLVNLRDMLTQYPYNSSPSSNLSITPTEYCEIIDDLDDIIRSIQRGIHDTMLPHGCNDPECEFKPDSKPSDESSSQDVHQCPLCGGYIEPEHPDSEDMEAR